VHQRRAPAALGRVTGREHRYDVGELGLGQVAVRPGAAEKLAQRFLVPFLGRGLRDHLLREHIERLVGNDDAVELAGSLAAPPSPRTRSGRRA